MYVRCIDEGSGNSSLYDLPKKGTIYRVLKVFEGRQCEYKGKKSNVWYTLENLGQAHSSLLFEDVEQNKTLLLLV